MSYGTIKVDTITFTDNSVDKSVSLSGLIQNPTFTGNITVTGTISGDVIRGGTTVSGATVTGTTANFVSGVFTTQISGATVTGTTASFTSGVFTNISGTTATITSGIIASGTDAAPSLAILADLDTGLFSPGANQLAVATNGTGRLFVNASGNVGVGTPSPNDPLTIVSSGTANSIVSAFDATASRAYFQVGGTTNGLYTQIGTDTSTTFINDFFGNGIAFQLAASEKARIDSSGRLGIGTSAPGANLDIARVFGDNLDIVRIGTTQSHYLAIARSSTTGAFSFQGNQAGANNILLAPTSGRVGIGTTSPSTSLHVQGDNTTGKGQLIVSSASAGQEARMTFIDGSDDIAEISTDGNNFYFLNETATGAFQWYTNGSERVRLDASGRLLVGTSSTSSSAGLQVTSSSGGGESHISLYLTSGTLVSTDILGRITFGAKVDAGTPATSYDAASIACWADATWSSSSDTPTRLVFSTTADGASTPTERLRITSAGLVGIGTPSPSQKFDLSAGANLNLGIDQIAHNSFANEGIGLTLSASDSDTDLIALGVVDTNKLGIFSREGIVFGAGGATTYSATTERMRLDDSGRLLVGTSTNIGSQNIQIGTATGTLGLYKFANNDDGGELTLANSRNGTVGSQTIVNNNDFLGRIFFRGSDGSAFLRGADIVCQVDGTPGANDMPGRLVFSTTADGASSPTERMRIDSTGYIRAVGTSSTARIIPNTDNVGYLGQSSERWQAVYAVNGTIQTSDRRQKTDITEALLGSDFVKTLKPVSYKWIEGGKEPTGEIDENEDRVFTSIPGQRTHWGFIAQDVKEAVDAAGVDFGGWLLDDKDDPDSQQALRYDQFIAPLTKALQEALAEIDVLKAKVAALEAS
jgi:hypothetical protein